MLTLYKFGSADCRPCAAMDRYTARVAAESGVAYDPSENGGTAIDVSTHPERVPADLGEMNSVPVLVVRDADGGLLARHDGAMSPTDLARWLKSLPRN